MTSRKHAFPVVLVAAALLLTPIAAAQTASRVPPATTDPVLAAQGVSGFETDAIAAIRGSLPKWAKPRIDEAGNRIVTIGQGKPHLLITTSVDEDGYLVSDITPDGYLRLHRVTTGASFRLFDQFIYGQPVVIRTTAGKLVPGVVGSLSAHLQRGRDAAAAPAKGLDDMWVDVGAQSAADVAALGVRLLHTVTLRERITALGQYQVPGTGMPGEPVTWRGGNRLAGVAAQVRQSANALLRLLEEQRELPKVTGTLTVAWTTQGVFGDRGAARLAREVSPDRVIAVTRAQASREQPDPRGAFGTLGAGPVVVETSAGLVDRARQVDLRVQSVPTLRVPAAWPAAITDAVALPVLFAQTPVETVDTRDVQALTALLRSEAGLANTGVGVVGPGLSGLPDVPTGIFAMLAPLVESYGVSGHETPVREAVAKQLPKWTKPEVDAKGNLSLSFGQGGAEILFVAHTDELGCEITDVRDDGLAAARRCGVYTGSMEAHPVLVHTSTGMVTAVMAPRPNYQRATEWQPKPDDVLVYFGTDSRAATEALGVKKGDTVTVRKQFQPLAGSRATARSIDDRAGCAALALALQKIDPAKIRSRVTFAWDVEEETGLVGAGVLAERLHPTYVFAVDTFVSSDTPIDPQRYARIPLGSGAVLRAVDNSVITPPDFVERIRKLAEARGIPVSVSVTSGGNDGSQFTKTGAIVLPISWPGRYSHSAVEVIDGRDLQALVDLIVAVVYDLK
jgi:putative aminopeptidase